MLFIKSNTIEEAISLRKWVDTMEEAINISITNDYFMPPRPHYDYKGNTLLLMPGFISEYFATKLVSVFPENQLHSLPVIYGTVLLNDGKTGKPLALLEGTKLTAMRTGAVGGLAIRYLSPKKAKSIGIIGAGVQGLHQAIYACNERQIENVYVFDTSLVQIETFKNALEEYHPHVHIKSAKDVSDLLNNSEIIITTTSSQVPVIPDNFTDFENKTFLGIGSYKHDMQELPDKLFKNSDHIYVDTLHAKNETGDIINPIKKGLINEDQIISIAEIISGKVKVDFNKPRIFKSVGMALFDLFASKTIYETSLKNNLGHKYEL